jgi:1-hydroxycarotenoid 3,4-desaturase
VELVEPRPAFRYLYPDGTTLDVFAALPETLASVERALGASARAELERFLARARRIWEAGAPSFVFGEAPTLPVLLRLSISQLGALTRIDALRSMYAAIEAQVKDERLRWLLARYATYNGSNVLEAPATLNCIAHVELALGGFGVGGGIHALVEALLGAATRLGVRVHLSRPVRRILVEGGRAVGVELADKEVLRASCVVGNADAAHVANDLLPLEARRALRLRASPSASGFNAILRARRRPADARPAHMVLFPSRYLDEFTDLFERDRPPEEPTVYLCAQEKAHGRRGWAEHEPLFVMANAPAEPADGPRDPAIAARLEARVLERLRGAGLIDADDELLWRRDPAELSRLFPGSRGSIYGASSNGMMAAFQRPPNRVAKLPGLYLASGSAHPGGGMPLAALSGLEAARLALADLGRNAALPALEVHP